MRVIYLSNCVLPDSRANTVHIMHMCQAFVDNGCDVALICRRATSEAGIASDCEIFSQYNVTRPFKLIRLRANWGKWRSVWFALRSCLNLILRRPDFVYGRFLASCFFASFVSRCVVWESHAPLPFFYSKVGRVIARLMISRMRFVVVITDALKDEYVQLLGLPASKLVVMPDGATPTNCSRVIRYANSCRAQVGYIGQLYPGKGMELIQRLVTMCPWAHFHIIGGQDKDVELWRLRLSGFENATFYGFLSYADTIAHRFSVDVLLAPYQESVYIEGSREDIGKWMSPLKIFEYMACGKPMIASDLPVLREVLQHDVNSFLCPPNDPGKWADALSQLMSDRALRDRLGSSALKDLLDNYTWEKRAFKILRYAGFL